MFNKDFTEKKTTMVLNNYICCSQQLTGVKSYKV